MGNNFPKGNVIKLVWYGRKLNHILLQWLSCMEGEITGAICESNIGIFLNFLGLLTKKFGEWFKKETLFSWIYMQVLGIGCSSVRRKRCSEKARETY